MSQLYPSIKPFSQEMFNVSDGHALYLEQSGTPDGIPVLYLHGGPGAGIGDQYRRFFDPKKYRIIGFDQRGCGQSTPFGQLKNNTSQLLIEDALAIKQHLKIKKWVLFGGSWGATLALLIAIRQPESVIGLILRGIFLAREEDYAWFLNRDGGAAQLFPEYYQDFLQPVRSMLSEYSIVDAYHRVFSGNNEVQKMAAIKAWCLWEARISQLHCQLDVEQLVGDLHRAISLALLECHYIRNKCFIEEDEIIQNMPKLESTPGTIVHGRYDSVCKIEAAFSLSQAWPASKLNIIPEAGHSAGEKYITQALCHATQAMALYYQELDKG